MLVSATHQHGSAIGNTRPRLPGCPCPLPAQPTPLGTHQAPVRAPQGIRQTPTSLCPTHGCACVSPVPSEYLALSSHPQPLWLQVCSLRGNRFWPSLENAICHSNTHRALVGCKSFISDVYPTQAQVIRISCCKRVSLTSNDLYMKHPWISMSKLI